MRPDTAWKVRRATPSDRDDTLRLMHTAFVEPDASVTRWNWLFTETPCSLPMQYLLATAGERIVGQYAAMPVRMQHAGMQTHGMLSLDTATDPEFERQGIFTTLARRLYDEASEIAPLVYGFPNQKSAPVLYKKLNWVELRPYPLLVRPLRGMGTVVEAQRPVVRSLANALDFAQPLLRLVELAEARLANARGATMTTLDGFGAWADELWARLAAGLGTCAIRDAAFLNWRFCRAPRSYHIHGLARGGQIVGFAVSSTRPWRGRRLAHLMELMIPKDDRAGARALLADVIERSVARGAVAIHAIATPRHPHRRELFRMGFLPMPASLAAGLSFGVRINGPRAVPDKALHVDDWYISGSDFDYY